MLNKLATSAPGVNPLEVIATGATQIRVVFPPDQLPGILVAYMAGIKAAFAICIAFVGIAFVISLANKWSKLNKEALKESGGAA